MTTHIEIYDTTLRDGSQTEGISFSVEDKIQIARKLDALGVDFIEGGWPGSNPKDAEFFERARSLDLDHARITAFSSTRKAGVAVEDDPIVQALLDSEAQVVTLVGKSSELHVTDVLGATLEENLDMIADTVAYLKAKGRTVFYDAEHFFDGYKLNPGYTLLTIQAAAKAGADCVILCDTNGGALPEEVRAVVEEAARAVDVPLGIHAHNDSELAVANSLAAVAAGARHVQGTINGIGERCGNANLVSIIANLNIKMGLDSIGDDRLARLKEISTFVNERANRAPDPFQPFVGESAFSHKGGLHAAAMAKVENSYQHIDPAVVGNVKRVVVSELSGRSNIVTKAAELGIDLSGEKQITGKLVEQIKDLENKGFVFEGAEGSFELLIRRALPGYAPPFELVDFMVLVERRRRAPVDVDRDTLSEAMVKVKVDGSTLHVAAEGNGPVDALDTALRRALEQFFPTLAAVRLTDYKVRIVDESEGADAVVRVLVDSTDGERRWSTVGSSTNIIDASWMALADSMEYWLTKYAAR